MPGENLHRDLAEVLTYYGEDERTSVPAPDLARYLVASLAALTHVLRALPEPPHGEPVPDGAAVSEGAQPSLLSPPDPLEDR
jgi:hypothetical protein